jgi:hypothetical protein
MPPNALAAGALSGAARSHEDRLPPLIVTRPVDPVSVLRRVDSNARCSRELDAVAPDAVSRLQFPIWKVKLSRCLLKIKFLIVKDNMARLYSIAVASLAIGAPLKWTDNLLSQHTIPDVHQVTRGVARGISWAALVRIALVRELHVRLGCAVHQAVSHAAELLASPNGSTSPGGWITIEFHRDAFERALHTRLAEALEMAPRPRRGRPPGRQAPASA